MNLITYKPHLEYLLERALEDEGLTPDQMTFREDKTCVLVDDDGPIGFFSFRFEDGMIRLMHFLVFKQHRSHKTMLRLWLYACEMVKSLGHAKFIVEIPAGRNFFDTLAKFWSGKDAQPYAKIDDGTAFYFMPVQRGGFNNENLHLH